MKGEDEMKIKSMIGRVKEGNIKRGKKEQREEGKTMEERIRG